MKTVSIAAMVLVLLGLAATIGLFAFEEGLNRAGCNLEAAALGVLAACLVACIMGFVSLREPAGKIAFILGLVLIVFYAYQFLRTESSSQIAPMAPSRSPEKTELTAPLRLSAQASLQHQREKISSRREVVVVTPKTPKGEARFEGFNDLRIISTGPVDGPIDNQNYHLHVGGYVGPFIGPGGFQWAGRMSWPGPHGSGAFYLRYATPPEDEQSGGVVIYGSGGQ